MISENIPKGWRKAKLLEVVDKLSTGPQYERLSCFPTGDVPVIDQSMNGYSGYHNDKPGVYASEDKPVVTFANHTCAVRLHKKPFSVIQNVFPLVAKEGNDTNFIFWLLKGSIQSTFYGGHWPKLVAADFPIPPLSEQKRIANILKEQTSAIEKAKAATEAQLEAAKALPAAYSIEIFKGHQSESWPKRLLGEVCEMNPRRPADLSKRNDNAPTTFVPMPSVDARLGKIFNPEVKPFLQVKKGYTYFAEGDVLFAKITPCMQNGKHAIAQNLIDGIGFGSTEFHVLKPRQEIISEWIHKYIRQPTILEDAMAHFTGAVGQQRVPDDYLSNLEIPVPSISEQKNIMSEFDKKLSVVDSLKKQLEEQIIMLNKMPNSILRQAFNGEL